MLEGVDIGSQVLGCTKEELVQEFGPDRMKEVDALPDSEHKKQMQMLREEFMRRRMNVRGLSLKNAEEANLRRVEGMVLEVDGKTDINIRQWANDLRESDFQFLLERILELENDPKESGSSEPSAK